MFHTTEKKLNESDRTNFCPLTHHSHALHSLTLFHLNLLNFFLEKMDFHFHKITNFEFIHVKCGRDNRNLFNISYHPHIIFSALYILRASIVHRVKFWNFVWREWFLSLGVLDSVEFLRKYLDFELSSLQNCLAGYSV